MSKKEIQNLLQKYTEGKCSEEEREKIESWYSRMGKDFQVDLTESDIEKDLQDIFETLPKPERVRSIAVLARIAAVLTFAVLSAGLYFYFQQPSKPDTPAYADTEKDILPGENKAVLTLADGSEIMLDNKASGKIAEQGNIKITKSGNGLLVYTIVSSQSSSRHASLNFNTISTPKGGQYQVILPDGTKVWLNAASSLKYPASFNGRERRVELTGEGYFEVAKNKNKPFKVLAANQEVEVLGTHFNINSYADEPSIKTTLLEGSVRVYDKQSGNSKILQPGEQSTLADHQLSVDEVNTSNAVAWKNGLFQFYSSDIKSVMRQLSRWYGVTVEFEGRVPDIKLWGKVYRNENASKALEMLSYFNLKYRIVNKDGVKKIVIMEDK